MATTIHLPKELLEVVDRRAAARGISRNLYIRRALERVVADEQEWSPAFLTELDKVMGDPQSQALLDSVSASVADQPTTLIPGQKRPGNKGRITRAL